MLIFDKMIIGGVRFVLGKLALAVEQELDDDEPLKQRLLAAQMQLELGELDEAEFAKIEAEVMVRLREIRERRAGPQLGDAGVEVVGVEVEAAEEASDLGPPASGGGKSRKKQTHRRK